jgi:hypothetical protein
MRVLGIETSCDETGIAIYDEKGLLANQLYSQVKCTLTTAASCLNWPRATTCVKRFR